MGKEMDDQRDRTKLVDLPTDCFEKIASYLDTRDNLNMLFSKRKSIQNLLAALSFGSISVSWRGWTS